MGAALELVFVLDAVLRHFCRNHFPGLPIDWEVPHELVVQGNVPEIFSLFVLLCCHFLFVFLLLLARGWRLLSGNKVLVVWSHRAFATLHIDHLHVGIAGDYKVLLIVGIALDLGTTQELLELLLKFDFIFWLLESNYVFIELWSNLFRQIEAKKQINLAFPLLKTDLLSFTHFLLIFKIKSI